MRSINPNSPRDERSVTASSVGGASVPREGGERETGPRPRSATIPSVAQELVIYTDESDKHGAFNANFYGGAAVWSRDLNEVEHRLESKKTELNMFREAKWQRVTSQYVNKYISLVDEIFDLAAEGKLRFRIMFTQTRYVPLGLDSYQREHEYQILYYQFVKHAFGLQYAADLNGPFRVRLYLDDLPDTKEKNAAFKGYVSSLSAYPPFRRRGIEFPLDQIAEVSSKEHVILQALDIALGAMQFRLNHKHLEKRGCPEVRGTSVTVDCHAASPL